MNNRRIIAVTGGFGFIGFNFIEYIIENTDNIDIINIDCRTYAAQYKLEEKLKYFREHSDRIIADYQYDISDKSSMEQIFEKDFPQIEGIINFAAETHVDMSIESPEKFIKSNVNGVGVLLEIVRKKNLRYHQVSTDEVYGSVDYPVNEKAVLNASSPYSSTKTSADLIILSYFKTFNSKVTISRTVNNYGPWQDDTKLIPKTITHFYKDQPIEIYGKGENIRSWLYVKDHCSGIWTIYESQKFGEIFNIGSSDALNNTTIVSYIQKEMNKPEELLKYIPDPRPGHDFSYLLNSDKIFKVLNWKPQYKFKEGISKTIEFYK